jgi:hypothetical protein
VRSCGMRSIIEARIAAIYDIVSGRWYWRFSRWCSWGLCLCLFIPATDWVCLPGLVFVDRALQKFEKGFCVVEAYPRNGRKAALFTTLPARNTGSELSVTFRSAPQQLGLQHWFLTLTNPALLRNIVEL